MKESTSSATSTRSSAHCYRCHGPDKQESSFRLDVRETAFAVGDFGEPAIIPGNAKDSPLFRFVSDPDADAVMPPDERLSKVP